ncbi:MAG TPA: DUF2207 domain-containing protein [Mogibacterium sp.]|nr:DUF2207 domain-containing protein [Mogibacterium sp.]
MKKAYKSKKNYLIKIARLAGLLLLVVMGSCLSLANVAVAEERPGSIDWDEEKSEAVANVAFEVKSYDLKAVVHKDHSIVVAQRIAVFLPDNAQKVEFSIPSGNFIVTDIEVENAEYKSEKADKASTISILDKDRLTKGYHVYNIKYTIKEFVDRDETKDLFYFKALLPEWKQPIGNVAIDISFPSDFPWGDIHYYAGQLGVQDVSNKLTYNSNRISKTIKITGEKIPENFGITIIAKLPDGYWQGALDGKIAANIMAATMLIVAAILLGLWFIGGRDPVVKREKQTKPIDNISPVEIGYIFSSRVRTRDIINLILYFGVNGYLRISEYQPKKYRLYRLEEPGKEARHIRSAYNILFEDVYPGRALEMEDIGDRIKRIKDSIREDIAAGYSTKEMVAITPISRAFRVIGVILLSIGLGVSNAMRYLHEYLPINYKESLAISILAVILMIYVCRIRDKKYSSSNPTYFPMLIITTTALILIPVYIAVRTILMTGTWLQTAIMFAASILSVFLISIMKARGKDNAVLASKFMQLRQFIYHPNPRDLLQNHMENSNYYYEMMPYAIMFGGASSWAISFLRMNLSEPEWYKNDREEGGFTAVKVKPTTVDYAQNIVTFCRTIEDAYRNMDRKYWRF